ncbi:MAG: hypothetical protein JWP99_1129 [Devosia sp.]|nr:hypothetical protein [Devosia sp.]
MPRRRPVVPRGAMRLITIKDLVPAVLLAALVAGAASAHGQDTGLRDQALDAAVDMFEQALPALGPVEFGVDVAAYRDALTLQRFRSGVWGAEVAVVLAQQDDAGGSCARFAAFVRLPPAQGSVKLVLCPRFFTPGADDLRVLTLLHETVHVVAGTDECQAMAFAARVEQAATGRVTPVDAYWAASGCRGSQYRLPGNN